MSDIVVDSSVVAKWVVPEPDSPQWIDRKGYA
jgi:predicted nucleic acid-binding protein